MDLQLRHVLDDVVQESITITDANKLIGFYSADQTNFVFTVNDSMGDTIGDDYNEYSLDGGATWSVFTSSDEETVFPSDRWKAIGTETNKIIYSTDGLLGRKYTSSDLVYADGREQNVRVLALSYSGVFFEEIPFYNERDHEDTRYLAIVSTTEPDGIVGQQWFNPSTGKLSIYTEDS